MPRAQTTVLLRWPGTGTLRAAREAIRSRSPIEIELPLEVHYALYRHLHPDAPRGPVEDVDACGGAELLGPIATVAGLEEIARLKAALRRAHYRVRVTSPEPRLSLLPPAKLSVCGRSRPRPASRLS